MNLRDEPLIQQTVILQGIGVLPSTNEMRARKMLDKRLWCGQTD